MGAGAVSGSGAAAPAGHAIAHGGGVAAASARHGGRPEDWLDLSTGINPCPPPLPAIDPRAWHRLPDGERDMAARQAAQTFYGCAPVLPLATPGTQAAIHLLPGLIGRGTVAILSPTYGEHARRFALAGLTVAPISGLEAITPDHAMAIVVNPNNPTGLLHWPGDLLALARRMAEWGGMLVVDEAFADALPHAAIASALGPEAGWPDNLIVLRSFGKFFGYAGLRLGFVLAVEPVLARLSTGLGPWPVSGPALTVTQALMAQDRDALVATIAARRAGLGATLATAGLTVIGGTPLFALVGCDNAKDLHEHLCRAHVLSRIFDYAPGWIRFGLAPDDAGDRRLLAALQAWDRA